MRLDNTPAVRALAYAGADPRQFRGYNRCAAGGALVRQTRRHGRGPHGAASPRRFRGGSALNPFVRFPAHAGGQLGMSLRFQGLRGAVSDASNAPGATGLRKQVHRVKRFVGGFFRLVQLKKAARNLQKCVCRSLRTTALLSLAAQALINWECIFVPAGAHQLLSACQRGTGGRHPGAASTNNHHSPPAIAVNAIFAHYRPCPQPVQHGG